MKPTKPLPDATACWRAVCRRDARSDGAFVFAVSTTGVYCRPSCGARRPRREHVAFFADGAAARAAGFRACKRCAPDARHADHELRKQLIAAVCAWIDAADERAPTLHELGARAGYSPFWLQRMFVQVLGVSPRQYAQARRRERLREALAHGVAVTAAMQRAGYGSSSRLHADAERALGMRPRAARTGGAGERLEYAVAACSLGRVLVAATARGLAAILLGDDDDTLVADLRRRFARGDVHAGDAAFRARIVGVIAFVDGRRPDIALPLDLRGTAFQQRVWRELQRIPAGRTADYTAIATRLGAPKSARAVAKACGDNPLAVVVPCHRVVRRDGDLAGYRWGLARKRALLERERPAASPRIS